MKKIKIANKILKKYIADNYQKESWPYVDFVNENRFLYEIKDDKNVSIEKSTAEELAEYAIEQIDHSVSVNNLLGF